MKEILKIVKIFVVLFINGYLSASSEPRVKESATFEFISQKKHGEDIIRVTNAKPDVRLNTIYNAIAKASSFVKNSSNFTGMLSIVCNGTKAPEYLIKRSLMNSEKQKKQLLSDDHPCFEPLNIFIKEIESFFSDLSNREYKSFDNEKRDVTEWYKDFKKRTICLFNDARTTNDADLRESLFCELETHLSPKIIVSGDIFNDNFMRIDKEMAHVILKLGDHTKRAFSGNHKVSCLPGEQGKNPEVFFKCDGRPTLKPGNVAMMYHLYKYCEIPIPTPGLLIFFDVPEGEPFCFVQSSTAVVGPGADELINPDTWHKDIRTIELDDREVFKQEIGAALTDPDDGKLDNFRYLIKTKEFISIDNEQVFGPPLERVKGEFKLHVKTILYKLHHMDKPMPDSLIQFFSRLNPEFAGCALLQAEKKQNERAEKLFDRAEFYFNNIYTGNALVSRLDQARKFRLQLNEHQRELGFPIKIYQTNGQTIINRLAVIQECCKRFLAQEKE